MTAPTDPAADLPHNQPPKVKGTQSLTRGLALIECVAEGTTDVKGIALRLGSPRSTVTRMLASLVAEGYLHHIPYHGYLLGPKLIRLGQLAQESRPLVALARPHLEALRTETRDTLHLGVIEQGDVVYLDKLAGTRGLEMRSRVGARMPVASTGLGKALMMCLPEADWPALYDRAVNHSAGHADHQQMRPMPALVADLRESLARGYAFDREENEPGIRCVAAPLRDFTGRVVAAISLASALPFMPDARMQALGPRIAACAAAISRDLGAPLPPTPTPEAL